MSLTRVEIVAGIVPVSLLLFRYLFCLQYLKFAKRPENMWVVVHTRCTTMFFETVCVVMFTHVLFGGGRGGGGSS